MRPHVSEHTSGPNRYYAAHAMRDRVGRPGWFAPDSNDILDAFTHRPYVIMVIGGRLLHRARTTHDNLPSTTSGQSCRCFCCGCVSVMRLSLPVHPTWKRQYRLPIWTLWRGLKLKTQRNPRLAVVLPNADSFLRRPSSPPDKARSPGISGSSNFLSTARKGFVFLMH